MRFSDRIGKTTPKTIYQNDDIDLDLKNSIWNVLSRRVFIYVESGVRSSISTVYKRRYVKVFEYFFKIPINRMEKSTNGRYKQIRDWYFACEWYEVYNFIEFVANNIDEEIVPEINSVLETEKSGYRFVNKVISPISDEVEIEEVVSAANLGDKFSGPREHIRRALEAFSRKPDGDYLTAIKEAISAVEGMAKVITNNDKATLTKAINAMEKQKPMHPAFRESFKKLYGYTSDEKGIRHALLSDEIGVDEADAHFMIVVCSAFMNFAVSRYQ